MIQTDTYDPSFFEKLRKAEEKHFWFQIRRKWIFDNMRKFIPPPANFLEVGCGTGNVSSFLSFKGYSVTGCEFYTKAINMAWPGFLRVQGDAKSLPFTDNSFDIVGLFDVLEHFEDDTIPLKEAIRVVKGGGFIVVTVPARKELWSWADEMSLHKRRYSIKKLEHIFLLLELRPLSIKYMFMFLYVLMKISRKKNKSRINKRNDYFKLNRLLNILLKGFFNIERTFSKKFPLPIGTSLIAIAKKNF